MKALTIYQPWASLVNLKAKPYEFREWDYSERYPDLVGQRIVNHASARPIKPAEIADLMERVREKESTLVTEIAWPLLNRLSQAYKARGILELSAGLGTCIIGKPIKVTDLFKGKGYDSNRLNHRMFAWPLTDIEPFAHPIPCRGLQGFWNWPMKEAA